MWIIVCGVGEKYSLANNFQCECYFQMPSSLIYFVIFVSLHSIPVGMNKFFFFISRLLTRSSKHQARVLLKWHNNMNGLIKSIQKPIQKHQCGNEQTRCFFFVLYSNNNCIQIVQYHVSNTSINIFWCNFKWIGYLVHLTFSIFLFIFVGSLCFWYKILCIHIVTCSHNFSHRF